MPIHDTENITCVEPADYPASRVSWSSDNAQVRFLGGSTGAEVCVWALGSAGTYSRLSLQFGDCPSARPSFGVKTVTARTVRVFVIPLIAKESSTLPKLDADIWTQVSNVYAQCGVGCHGGGIYMSVSFCGCK